MLIRDLLYHFHAAAYCMSLSPQHPLGTTPSWKVKSPPGQEIPSIYFLTSAENRGHRCNTIPKRRDLPIYIPMLWSHPTIWLNRRTCLYAPAIITHKVMRLDKTGTLRALEEPSLFIRHRCGSLRFQDIDRTD